MWINEDIGHGDDENVEACFHLSNCYVWKGGDDGFVSEPIDIQMGGYAIPEGYRDVCIDELSYDTNLWRQSKKFMNKIAVGGGYLNRVGEYIERKNNDAGMKMSDK